jgi:hypothetical protein
MVKRGLVAALAMAATVACGWASLGPEATLRDASAGADVDVVEAAPIVDAVSEPEAARYKCGLPPDPNAACNACNEQHCCDLGVQCGQDPRCATAINCSLRCVFDTTCIAQCDDEYADAGVFLTFENCAISQCINDCLPGPDCLQLAQCCPLITDVTAQNVCIGTVNALDEANCKNTLDNVLRPQLGPTFCVSGQDGGAD